MINKELNSNNKYNFSNLIKDNLRQSNSTLPLLMYLPLKASFIWTKNKESFYHAGWKTFPVSSSVKKIRQTGQLKLIKLSDVLKEQKNNINSLNSQFQLDFNSNLKINIFNLKNIESSVIRKNNLADNFYNSNTPKLNDTILSTKSSLDLTNAVWSELYLSWQKKRKVYGRILNTVNGGFSVGIAGYIAFLPKSRLYNKTYQIGRLIPFQILNINLQTKNIVLTGQRINKKVLKNIF
jgi:hypothetical protein